MPNRSYTYLKNASALPHIVFAETWNVGEYFDFEGHFDEWGMGDAVKKVVTALEQRAKDRKKKDKKNK